jgi:hypothetical protein
MLLQIPILPVKKTINLTHMLGLKINPKISGKIISEKMYKLLP